MFTAHDFPRRFGGRLPDYDIETTALIAYPNSYRRVRFLTRPWKTVQNTLTP
jgi:hypothetical protein